MDHMRELQFLQRLALQAAQTLDAPSLVRLVINETTGAMGVDVCSVYLLDPHRPALTLAATNGLSQTGVGRVRLSVGEGVTGWAAQERRPVTVPDVRTDDRFRWLSGVDQARFVSMCSVPIISADRLVGVINVQTDAHHDFDDEEVGFLAAIAAQVAGVLERSSLHTRLEGQVADLRRSEEIHRRFTELALAGGGIGAICAEIARQAAASVALYDDEGEHMSPAGGEDGGLPARLTIEDREPVPAGDGPTILPVRAGSETLAWLAVGDDDAAPDPVRRRALEHGVTVLALELSRERAAAEAERRLRGDVVEELLATRPAEEDAARLVERAARLGYRLRRRMWVVVIDPDDPAGARALGERSTVRRLVRALSAVAETRHAGAIVVERAGTVVLLIPHPATAHQVERTALAALGTARQLMAGSSLSCGVSGDHGGPTMLHDLAEQARLAIRVGRRLRRAGEVNSYRRLGAERLLLAVNGGGHLEEFVAEWLGPLERQEARGRRAAPLIETIDALSSTGWSPRAAARHLDVHVNTLLYRIQRARELTQRDLDDPDVRLALALALRARTLVAARGAG